MSLEISQNYYPELLHKMHIINSPFIFKSVWSVIKNWVDKKTRDKININTNLPTKELIKDIGIYYIPFNIKMKISFQLFLVENAKLIFLMYLENFMRLFKIALKDKIILFIITNMQENIFMITKLKKKLLQLVKKLLKMKKIVLS